MNPYHLKYFVDAAKENSISIAAKKNLVSHSAVSQAIKNVEQLFNVKLISHEKRKFILTDIGRDSIPLIESILLKYDSVKEQIKNSNKEPFGELTVWAPQSLYVDQLYKSILKYKKLYPKVNIKLQTGAAYLVKQNVANQKCHLGITLDDESMNQFESKILNQGEFCLVAKNKIKDITKCEIITTAPEKAEVIHLKNEYKKIHNTPLKLKTHIMSWGLIKEFVMQSDLAGYLPRYVVQSQIKDKSLTEIPSIGKPYKYIVKAIWEREKPISRNAKLLLDILSP